MRSSTLLLCAAACLLSGACKRSDQSNVSMPASDGQSADQSVANADVNVSELRLAEAETPKAPGCPVTTHGWFAFVQPVHGKRVLAVGGEVQANSGGWKFNLKPGPLDKSNPPIQHFTLEAIPPGGIVILPVTWQYVYATTDAVSAYKAVVIDCGGEEVARIREIPEHPEIETGPAPVQPEEGNRS